MESSTEAPHVAMVPTPGMGHLIPLLQLAKTLVQHHNFTVTFIVPNDGTPMQLQKHLLHSQPPTISSIFLPPITFHDLPCDSRIETRITLSLSRSLPSLRAALHALTLSKRVVALVVDLFGVEAFDVTKEFGVSPYIFFLTNARVLSLVFHLPTLHDRYSCDFRDLPEPIYLPGCFPVHGRDIMDPIQVKNNEAYEWMLYIAKKYNSAAGIMVNSFIDLEPGAFKALMEDKVSNMPPIYPVGPLIQNGSTGGGGGGECECLRWLDQQPNESVLFVCFGSGGTLSQQQVNEMALGLEKSGQRFLWVVKAPHDKAANATYFGGDSVDHDDPLDFLPKGFLERTKEVGLVVPSWAPQIQVLSHKSTAGFMTHCGWNSTLEGIVHGVPLIAWPLYAEQKMNAVLLADDLKVALRVKVGENGLVGNEDIANYVRLLFEGEEGKVLRKKMTELKGAASKVLSQDGSSAKALAHVAEIWKKMNP